MTGFKNISDTTRKSGQAIIFILLALVTLIFLLLYNIDLHQIVRRKNQTTSAGDAAVLAAARWQGASINLVGELNLMHIMALAEQNQDAVNAITNMQKRLCFSGPMTALFASQIAAKNNHMYVDEDMTALIEEHADTVRNVYPMLFNGSMYFPEPWPGAWDDYADMLEQIAADGIAAGPDNANLYGVPSGGHLLLNKGFYDAIDGRNWCWFYFNANSLLMSYNSYHDWPPLPEAEIKPHNDCEFYSLGLSPYTTRMELLFDADALQIFFRDAGFNDIPYEWLTSTNVMESIETWHVYDSGIWDEWLMIQSSDNDFFPITGPVREQYNYAGADAVVRVSAGVNRITPGVGGEQRKDHVIWTAAAKPFGYLEVDGTEVVPTAAANFVLPAFRNVRLIPIDSASGSGNGSSDVEWVRHIRDHVYTYVDVGPKRSQCRYCNNLVTWENKSFRQTGIDWLAIYCNSCYKPKGSGGGGGGGGGSRRGH